LVVSNLPTPALPRPTPDQSTEVRDQRDGTPADIYLAEESIGKFTEDVDDPRCLGCGAKARKALVMNTPEFKFMRECKGKKLAQPSRYAHRYGP